jgi:hypothetical protein
MKTTVSYEWTLHEVDEYGDIVDHHFSDDLQWFLDRIGHGYSHHLKEALEGSLTWQLELWRNRGNEEEGLVCRGYGYYDADTGLAKTFDLNATGDRESDGPKVPAKYFKQIEHAKKILGIA